MMGFLKGIARFVYSRTQLCVLFSGISEFLSRINKTMSLRVSMLHAKIEAHANKYLQGIIFFSAKRASRGGWGELIIAGDAWALSICCSGHRDHDESSFGRAVRLKAAGNMTGWRGAGVETFSGYSAHDIRGLARPRMSCRRS